MGAKLFFETKKAFIEFIKNKSDFTIEIISQTDDWIVFRCTAKINKPRCGTGGGTGGNKRMTLNKLAEIVLNLSNTVETLRNTVENLSNTVETGFANVNRRLDNLEKDVSVLKQDVADIKVRVDKIETRLSNIESCPTIQKELNQLHYKQ